MNFPVAASILLSSSEVETVIEGPLDRRLLIFIKFFYFILFGFFFHFSVWKEKIMSCLIVYFVKPTNKKNVRPHDNSYKSHQN